MILLNVCDGFSVEELKRDSILRINEHVDGGWFWSRYSASPYIGCSHGCSYCFVRAEEYGTGYGDGSDSFSGRIKAVMNAPELLEKELKSKKRDVIIIGDYQPAEKKLRLSRKMLKVCRDSGFPVMVITKSPLVTRDIDVIKDIGEASWACVVFSIGSRRSEGYIDYFEPGSPSIESRFDAMKTVSDTGIYTGTALIPVLPFITDDENNLETIVRKTVENGGKFVLGGGLVLLKGQKGSLYDSVGKYDKNLPERYTKLYGSSSSPQDDTWAKIGMKIKQICQRQGIDYRIKRFVEESRLAINKRVSESIFLNIYELELKGRPKSEMDEYRKLGWMVDELRLPVDTLISVEGVRKLSSELKPREVSFFSETMKEKLVAAS